MIIYQTNPCRLYPQIFPLIKEQFNNSINIHEIFELVDDSQSSDPNNKLKISPKNHIFQIHPKTKFLYGIFDINKIAIKKSDFLFTINFDQNKITNQEIACRDEDIFVISDYNLCLYTLMKQFNKYSDEELIEKFRNREDIIVNYKNVKYRIRNGVQKINKYDYDYVGVFSDFEQTIEDLKRLTNLDLSDLIGEKILNYQKH